jgi:hypothetical protein
MTLLEFRDLLLMADPDASHYESIKKGNYTVWKEYGTNSLQADDKTSEKAWKLQIDRLTKIEYDPVADAITAMLENQGIAYEYVPDFEPDTGYMHHIWTCEVI